MTATLPARGPVEPAGPDVGVRAPGGPGDRAPDGRGPGGGTGAGGTDLWWWPDIDSPSGIALVEPPAPGFRAPAFRGRPQAPVRIGAGRPVGARPPVTAAPPIDPRLRPGAGPPVDARPRPDAAPPIDARPRPGAGPPVDMTAPTQIIDVLAPDLLPGTEFVGVFEGSGYREPPHLVRRGDGQLVRLPTVLWQVLELLDARTPLDGADRAGEVTGPRTLAMVAGALRARTGDGYLPEHIAYLVDQKLAPLGLTHFMNGAAPVVEKPNAFLALKYKATVVSERASWTLAGLTMFLFHPVPLAAVLSAFFLAEFWALGTQDIGQALQALYLDPAGVLLVVLVSVLSAAFHEVGHAAACRYGGARPGTMGCGLYLVWPAFYTDLTDSYRLGRAGRIRADLGGVYFNAIWVVGMVGCSLWTGSPVFLVAVLSVNMEILQQLLPSLRFDGYHIMADVVGIPDLYKYIGPILRRVFLRRPPDGRLAELKRWPQILISGWVVCVIPALVIQLGFIAVHLPDLVRSGIAEADRLIRGLGGSGSYALDLAAAVLQIVLMAIPIIGVLLVLWQVARMVTRPVITKYRTDSFLPGSDAFRYEGRHRVARRCIDRSSDSSSVFRIGQ